MKQKYLLWILLAGFIGTGLLSGCRGNKTVEVTATPPIVGLPTSTRQGPTDTPIQPTPNPTRVAVAQKTTIANTSGEQSVYVVQPGDTLRNIASQFGVSADDIIAANTLPNPDLLEVGQLLVIPEVVATPAPTIGFKTIPDSELVYGPTAADFNIATYIKGKTGFLYAYSELFEDGEYWSGVELINKVALDYSINPRLLLALLEYQSGWISNPDPSQEAITYPYGIFSADIPTLYGQLLRTANWLNSGYYGWRYRGLISTAYSDGTPLTFAPDLNAGTVAVQYFFAQINSPSQWAFNTSEFGFFQTYLGMFGDPFPNAYEPIVPNNLTQPTMTLPFPAGQTWYFTGGPHGGYNSGSAWASIDFAPPEPREEILNTQGYCYISEDWVAAVANGIIARSGQGYVILDLDGDGNEHTGWNVVYLHISSQDVIPAGTRVQTGDLLGHPSCEGGFSNATHLHFGRRYNGEWMPITCHVCASDINAPPMVLSGWTFIGYRGQEYQGYAVHKTEEARRAEQGREDPINQFSY